MAKIVLTERQFESLIKEETTAQFLFESWHSSLEFHDLKHKIKMAIIGGIALTTIFSAIHKLHIDSVHKKELIEFARIEEEKRKQDSIFNVKVEACKKYIVRVSNYDGGDFLEQLVPETTEESKEQDFYFSEFNALFYFNNNN